MSAIFEKYRVRSKDGTVEEVGTNDKRDFIQLSKLLSCYEGTRSFLKAAYSLCKVLLIPSTSYKKWDDEEICNIKKYNKVNDNAS